MSPFAGRHGVPCVRGWIAARCALAMTAGGTGAIKGVGASAANPSLQTDKRRHECNTTLAGRISTVTAARADAKTNARTGRCGALADTVTGAVVAIAGNSR